MNQYVRIGNVLQLETKNHEFSGTVLAKSSDEIIVSYKHSKSLADQVIIANTVNLNGTQISQGQKILVTFPNGKKVSFYVSYLLGKDGVVISPNKVPSYSSIKWLLRLLKNFI